MKQSTKNRKKAASDFHTLFGEERLAKQLLTITNFGKQAFDSLHHDLGRMLVESIFLIERENVTGPDHAPLVPGVFKWGSEGGSVFVGDQKVRCDKPRIVGPDGEITLATYQKLKERGQFSEELLARLMAGASGRRPQGGVVEGARAPFVSPSSRSPPLFHGAAQKRKKIFLRDLAGL